MIFSPVHEPPFLKFDDHRAESSAIFRQRVFRTYRKSIMDFF